MKRYGLHVCLMLFFLGVINPDAPAQHEFRTDLLARMAASMQISSLDTLQEGIHWQSLSYKGDPVTVIVRNHRIEHIGYALFTPFQRSALPAPVCNLLERYALEINLPLKREKSTVRQIAEDGISFEKGTFSFFRELIKDTTYQVTVENRNGKQYAVSWHKAGTVCCSVQFPVDFGLLNGSEMLENERRIGKEIEQTPATSGNPARVSRDQLLPTWQTNYFILPGESYYTDELNTNRYYEQDKEGEFRLVYHSRYPLESLANLLTTTEIENQFILDIRLKKYGCTEETISVPLSRWTGFCLDNGCKPFFGVISYDGNLAVCELIMRNTQQGYNHILKVTFDIRQLENKKGVIQARLNSYVPASKIKYLFDEIRQ